MRQIPGDSPFRIRDVWRARDLLKRQIARTPLIFSTALSRRAESKLFLKPECWQVCGCFKVRGAVNAVTSLTEEQRGGGLVTCSSGNHGTALAYAARISGSLRTKIFLPTYADPSKVRKLTNLGAEAALVGDTFLETLQAAQNYAEEQGATYVHSHSDLDVIAGQGTIGLEILEDLPDVQTVLVPVGGGGLISGIASVIKAVNPSTEIIGIEPTAAPGAFVSFRDGFCHERIDLQPSIADGLVGTLTQLTWEISRHVVDRIVLVEEEEIISAMRILQRDEQMMVEGAAASGLAAVLEKKVDVVGKKAVIVLTGRNINAERYNELMSFENSEEET